VRIIFRNEVATTPLEYQAEMTNFNS